MVNTLNLSPLINQLLKESEHQYFFVVNPNSQGDKTGKEWSKYEKIIRKSLGNNFGFKLADGIGTGMEITKDAIQDGYTTIISVGGEGTTNEVVNGILSSNIVVTTSTNGTDAKTP